MKPQFCTDCDAYLAEGAQAGSSIGQGVRTISEADIFGPGSELVRSSETLVKPLGPMSWIDSAAYEILVVTVFLLFCFLLYTYRKNLGLLIKTLLKRTPLEKVYGEQTLAFKHFLRISQLFAVLLATGTFIRLATFFGLSARIQFLTPLQINLVVPLVLLAIGFAAFYRILAIRIIADVTQGTEFFSRYRFMTRIFSTLVSLTLAPFFLLCALYDGSVAHTLVYLLAGLCGLAFLGYLKLGAQFFLERKVSILQWFLYLCAVEFLPFSFLWFLWMRNMA